MAAHEFFGTVSADEATTADEVTVKGQVDSAVAAVQAAADAAVARANHTGTQSADTIVDGTTNVAFLAAERTKLAGIAAGATVNATDEFLLDRANHIGLQTVATLSDFGTEVDTRIQAVVGAAPAALDTLSELASALGGDANFSATVTGQISGIDTRVDALEANAGTGAFKTNVGDGAASLFTVTHSLGTLDVVPTVRRVSDGQIVYPVVAATDVNTVTVDFGASIPTTNAYRLVVQAA